ncbi:CATRA conflict system CASPASE/TPR repeat-associated protein [Streptomyces sp. NPDC005820]|uniref:CATRA conflict system CASPASE/TPR repeat-associated protein n=1 Tax=Streptomyces sp. NPDC005820 TaxID=3157069 RepID=UPI0033F4259D
MPAGPRERDMVVHVFYASARCTPGSPAHDHLRAVWAACRDRFGMDAPALAGVPADLPTDLPAAIPATGSDVRVWAAAEDGARSGDHQAVCYAVHEMLGVTVVLTHGGDRAWADADSAWQDAVPSVPQDAAASGILQAVRVYRGVCPHAPLVPADADEAVVVLREQLPAGAVAVVPGPVHRPLGEPGPAPREVGAGGHVAERRLLEQGRGVMLRQSLDRRAERRWLRAHHPQLLTRLDRARQALDEAADQAADQAAGEPDPQRAAVQEWDALVRTVRQETGLPFLTGPRTPDLLRAGEEGPVVVVNCARTRSDALIVLPGGITVVPLPGLSPEYAGELARGLDRAAALAEDDPGAAHPLVGDVLAELGARVAEPVLTALAALPGLDHGDGTAVTPSDPADSSPSARLPRLWWCPTGQSAFLPLHAARLPDGTWLQDRWVSSYTVTLRTLVESRASGTAATVSEAPRSGAEQQRAAPPLIVCVPRPGEQDPLLRHADEEARRVLTHLPGASLLPGERATPEAVLTGLRASRWLHFIGHAEQLPTAEGGALLRCRDTGDGRDGAVTATEIAGLGPGEAELAYLSACETATGDIDLPDEAAHLAGALQMAGFRHVIAAQWAVSDRRAPDLADAFYRQITGSEGPDADRSARALHHVVTTLRHARPDAAALWAPYVHVGP